MIRKRITLYQKLKIYFRITPFIVGEVLLSIGLFMCSPSKEWTGMIDGIFLILIGLGIVIWKITKLFRLINSAHNGIKCVAYIITVGSSDLEHNGRSMNAYGFEYQIEGKSYVYNFRSAYQRELTIGCKYDAYVDLKKGRHLFIPRLYGIDNF